MVGGFIQLAIGIGISLFALALFFYRKSFAGSSANGLLNQWLRKCMTAGHSWGMLLLGLLTGLLPCGVLYAALARALIAGSVWQGGWLMVAFWLGTTPLLLLVGVVSGGAFRLAGNAATAVLALAMLSTGLWLAFKGVQNLGHSTENPKMYHTAFLVRKFSCS
jgi:sulfite exporter TauE/SafE